MKTIWGAVVVLGCLALWGGALVGVEEQDEPQGGGAGLTPKARQNFRALPCFW